MRDRNEMMPDGDPMDREPVFHERIQLLKEEGYRGFTVTGSRDRWQGVVLVTHNRQLGRTLESDGETLEEAYKKMVDLIDHALEDG